MKRAVFAPLLMIVTFLALSCAKSPSSNQPVNPPPPPANKPVKVTITYAEGPPEQFRIDVDDGVRISMANLDTIKWRVKYVGPGSANAADVTIDDFRSGSDTNPFGGGTAANNKFTFDPSPGGQEKTADTQAASKAGVFKYKISVTLPNGKVLIVDPVVIIDN